MTKELLADLRENPHSGIGPDALVQLLDEREALLGALRELRINMIAAACDGSCLCGSDQWLSWHNGTIDAAIIRAEGE